MKALAEYHDLTPGDLIEWNRPTFLEGKSAFGAENLKLAPSFPKCGQNGRAGLLTALCQDVCNNSYQDICNIIERVQATH